MKAYAQKKQAKTKIQFRWPRSIAGGGVCVCGIAKLKRSQRKALRCVEHLLFRYICDDSQVHTDFCDSHMLTTFMCKRCERRVYETLARPQDHLRKFVLFFCKVALLFLTASMH